MHSPSHLRYVAGALAAAAALACAGAALIGWCYVLFSKIVPWLDQQIWIVQFPLKCVLGLTLVFGAVFAWNAARATWFHFVGAPVLPGETHGRHAKWRPGYAPPEPEAGACPKCGFTHAWDGPRCGHCHYSAPNSQQPTTNNQ